MKAIELCIALLFTVHVFWACAYVAGSVLWAPDAEPPASPGDALVEITIRTASGFALIGFATFALGLVGGIDAIGAAACAVVLVAAFALRRDAPWSARFWTRRFAVWRAAASPMSALIYVAALPMALLAARPDSGSDATTGYLVYATDWARAHALVVDFHIRPTFYADNWILIYTWLVAVGRSGGAAMMSWLTGLVSALGVFGFVAASGERRAAPASPVTIAIAAFAVVSLAVSPAFLRYMASPLIDLTIGLFFLASALALVRALRSNARDGLADLIVCAAFFIGMKTSLAVFVAVFAAAIVAVLVRAGSSRRRVLAAVAALLILSSPWYVKNFVQAGDPIAPVLNLAFHGADPKWTRSDLRFVENDLASGRGGPARNAAVPFGIVFDTQEWQFREAGTSFMMMLLLLPPGVLAYCALRRRSGDDVRLAFAALLTFMIAYWLSTSHVARYSMEFVAAFTAFIGSVLADAAARRPRAAWAAVACAAVLAIPSPGAAAFYDLEHRAGDDFYRNYTDLESWSGPRLPLYPEVEYVTGVLRRAHREDLTVYRADIEVDRLEWTERGITATGDLVGPERYSGFFHALYDDDLAAYVARFHIGVFIIAAQDRAMSPGLRRRFDEEARAIGFRRVQLPDRPFTLYFSPELPRG